MERGNVLVIGNSGVGKSTLINAVLGEEKATTGGGISGVTSALEIYESDAIPFRIIDSIGFEPSWLKRRKAIGAVKDWSKACAKQGKEDNQINLIWFCVDGTSRKLFPETIQSLLDATNMWKSVPVVVVITKSYSFPEREDNIKMVEVAFASKKKYEKRLKGVVPVVADVYPIDETTFVAPNGIEELIECTNTLMPEGIKAGKKDLDDFILGRKVAWSQGVIAAATAGSAAISAVPAPLVDAAAIVPIQISMVRALSKTYGVENLDGAKQFIDSIVNASTMSAFLKTVLDSLKFIPGINLAASVVNAIVAASMTLAIGEIAMLMFEKIYRGEKTVDDLEWAKASIEEVLSKNLVDSVVKRLEEVAGGASVSEVVSDATKEAAATA